MVCVDGSTHKQLFQLLKAVEHTQDELCCIVSKPVQGDTEYFDMCFNFAATLPNVLWISQYLNDGEVLAVSHKCKAALFPYIEYGAIGVSAAVKLLLNNLNIGIFTSFASHFSDFPDETKAITKLASIDRMLNEPTQIDLAARKKWVRDHNFLQAGTEHLKLYELA